MELDIQAITREHIAEMHESGKIEAAIKSGIEKTVLEAVKSVTADYALERAIRDEAKKHLQPIATEIGLDGYANYVASVAKNVVERSVEAEQAKVIEQKMQELLLQKHDGITIADIMEKYREYVLESTERDEREEYGEFLCECDIRDEGAFVWYTVYMSENCEDERHDADISFTLSRYGDEDSTKLFNVMFEGERQKGKLIPPRMNYMQALLLNLLYNETPIIFGNVQEIDTSYPLDEYDD